MKAMDSRVRTWLPLKSTSPRFEVRTQEYILSTSSRATLAAAKVHQVTWTAHQTHPIAGAGQHLEGCAVTEAQEVFGRVLLGQPKNRVGGIVCSAEATGVLDGPMV